MKSSDNPIAWQEATREVDLLLRTNKMVLETLSEVKLAPALYVDYDAKVGTNRTPFQSLESYNFEGKTSEWVRSPDQRRALDHEVEYLHNIEAHHKDLASQIEKNEPFISKSKARTFDEIVKRGPKDIQEHTMLQAAQTYLSPQEIVEAIDKKKNPKEMEGMIQEGQVRMGNFVRAINAQREKQLGESKEVTIKKYESLDQFTEIDGALEQIRNLNKMSAEIREAGANLGRNMSAGGAAIGISAVTAGHDRSGGGQDHSGRGM